MPWRRVYAGPSAQWRCLSVQGCKVATGWLVAGEEETFLPRRVWRTLCGQCRVCVRPSGGEGRFQLRLHNSADEALSADLCGLPVFMLTLGPRRTLL